jgi:hypothetical protein
MTPGDAALAAQLLAVDPLGLGGAVWSGPPGPERDAWVGQLREALPAQAPCLRLPVHVDDVRRASVNRGVLILAGGPLLLAQPEFLERLGADATAQDARQAILVVHDRVGKRG